MTVFAQENRLLVVVAHPDDETFGCGSLLIHAAAAGLSTAVCCATRGEAGEWPADMVLPGGGIGEQRERELRDAAASLGVERVDLLDFVDSGLHGEPASDTLVAADPGAVATALRAVIRQVEPDVVVTLDGTDGHRDHARIRDVTVAVAGELDLPVYLHCLPRRLMLRWAELMRRRDAGSPYLAVGNLGTPDEDIDVVIDTTAHLERREHAISLHRSQVSPYDDLPEELRREWLTREHLVGPLDPSPRTS